MISLLKIAHQMIPFKVQFTTKFSTSEGEGGVKYPPSDTSEVWLINSWLILYAKTQGKIMEKWMTYYNRPTALNFFMIL